MKRWLFWLCLVLTLLHLINIAYSKRAFLLEKYDPLYWQDRFEHSQWQLPLSRRIIGDDGLLAYAGFQLAHGLSPEKINPEMPPVGKYLLGFSILLFGNPGVFVFIFAVFSLALMFLLGRQIFRDNAWAILLVLLFSLDPLIFSQFWPAWVDIFQLFFLLLSWLLLFKILKTEKASQLRWYFLTGGAMAFFSESKPAILLPLLVIFVVIAVLKHRSLKALFFFLGGFALVELLVYSRYFYLGNSLLDFLRLQKFRLNFYLSSTLKPHPEALLKILFTGKFPDIVSRQPVLVREWSLLWPVITLAGLTTATLTFLKKSLKNKSLALFLWGSTGLYFFVPIYPRYLLVLLPFLYLFTVKAVSQLHHPRLKKVVIFSLIIFSAANAFWFLRPTANDIINSFSYNLEHQFFQDIYAENIAVFSRPPLSREEFRELAQKTYQAAGIQNLEVENLPNQQIRITYKTQDLGEFQEIKKLPLVLEKGKWKIVWNWNLLLNGFKPQYRLKSEVAIGKRGRIIKADGTTLAEDETGQLISINPSLIELPREAELLQAVSAVTYLPPLEIQNAYLENALPQTYVPIATAFKPSVELLSTFAGVRLSNYPARIYYDDSAPSLANTAWPERFTRIYSSSNYHGITGVEKNYEDVLAGKNGGRLMMLDQNQGIVRTIIENTAVDGQDIRL